MFKFDANILVPVLLFILLSPGFLVTISTATLGLSRFIAATPTTTLLVHAVVFALVYYLLRKYFPQFY